MAFNRALMVLNSGQSGKLGLGVLGFWGLGFRGSGSRVWGLGLRV